MSAKPSISLPLLPRMPDFQGKSGKGSLADWNKTLIPPSWIKEMCAARLLGWVLEKEEGQRLAGRSGKFLKVKAWEPFLKWVEKEKRFTAPWALKSWQGEITWKLVLFGWPFFSSVNSQCKLLKSVALTPNELQFFSLGTQFGGMRRMGLGSQKPWDGTRTNPSHYFSFTHYPATPTGLETVVALANQIHGRKDEISPVSNSTTLSLRQLQTS